MGVLELIGKHLKSGFVQVRYNKCPEIICSSLVKLFLMGLMGIGVCGMLHDAIQTHMGTCWTRLASPSSRVSTFHYFLSS